LWVEVEGGRCAVNLESVGQILVSEPVRVGRCYSFTVRCTMPSLNSVSKPSLIFGSIGHVVERGLFGELSLCRP